MQQLKKMWKRPLFWVLTLLVLTGAVLSGGVAVGADLSSAPALLGVLDGDDGEGEDVPITGEALEKASAAALEYLGEGIVTDTEVGDEEGYYEVEVTLANGTEVDVHLNENFEVLGQESDENDQD